MSDGPHKTLPLRKHWKDAAERAAKAAFSPAEVCEALPVALIRDFVAEAPLEAIAELFGVGKQAPLFAEDYARRLDELRQGCRGSVVGNTLIDCAIALGNAAQTEAGALQAALESALDEHLRGTFRSMEEHYLREGSARSAAFLRTRLDQARSQLNLSEIAAAIGAERIALSATLKLTKKTGIDEGPSL